MLVGAGLLVGVALGSAAGGWWMLGGLLIAAGLATYCRARAPGDSDHRAYADANALVRRYLTVAVLIALVATFAGAFAVYLTPNHRALGAVGLVTAGSVACACGARQRGWSSRA
jgi:hypothetical protein